MQKIVTARTNAIATYEWIQQYFNNIFLPQNVTKIGHEKGEIFDWAFLQEFFNVGRTFFDSQSFVGRSVSATWFDPSYGSNLVPLKRHKFEFWNVDHWSWCHKQILRVA